MRWLQRVGIWLLVAAIYWLAGAYAWPVVRDLFAGDEPEAEVWTDEDMHLGCVAWHGQVSCHPLPVEAPLYWVGPTE